MRKTQEYDDLYVENLLDRVDLLFTNEIMWEKVLSEFNLPNIKFYDGCNEGTKSHSRND